MAAKDTCGERPCQIDVKLVPCLCVLLHAFAAHSTLTFSPEQMRRVRENRRGELNFWRVKFALLAVAVFQCQREIQTSLRLVTHLSSITLAQCEPMLCISTSTPSFKSLSGSCITRFISRCCRARVLWPHNMLVIQAI